MDKRREKGIYMDRKREVVAWGNLKDGTRKERVDWDFGSNMGHEEQGI